MTPGHEMQQGVLTQSEVDATYTRFLIEWQEDKQMADNEI